MTSSENRKVNFITISRTGTHIIHNSVKNQSKEFFYRHTDEPINQSDVLDGDFLYLTRINLFDHFMALKYDFDVLENVRRDYVAYDEKDNDIVYNQQLQYINEVYKEKIPLAPKHTLVFFKVIENFYQIVSQCPPTHDILYYEDLVNDPRKELEKWNMTFEPDITTIKTRKVPYTELYDNIDETRDFILNANLSLLEHYNLNGKIKCFLP